MTRTDPDLGEVAASIVRLDDAAQVAARERRATRPEDRGRLDDLAVWLSGAQGVTPRALERVVMVLVAGPALAPA